MSRWKRLSSRRLLATTLVLFASSLGGMAGCEDVDTTPIPPNTGGAGGTGNEGGGGMGGSSCTPVDDNNDCTTDECDASGKPVNTPIAEGSTCTTNGGSLCDATGACVQCLVATDCGTDDTCKTHACTMGVCSVDFAPADTPLPMQTMGDCKLKVCDGNGQEIDTNDDADLPDDMEECTDDVCTAGEPSNPVKAQGTNCGTSGTGDPLVCNATGQCVGCNAPSDCPGIDDECGARSCNNGVCGMDFTAKDVPVVAQTDNNCLLHVCDGMGKMVDIVDDTDLPLDDGNACTGETCSMGVPNHPNLLDGTACSDGTACTVLDTCQMGTCMPGTAVTCMASDQCHVVGTCDPATGMCSNPEAPNGTGCNDGNACTQTDTCNAGTCTGTNQVICPNPDQCHLAGTCDPATGICSNPTVADGTGCNDNDACTQTDSCIAGTCTGANPVMCPAADQCHLPSTCNSMTGICPNQPVADGTVCTSNMVTGACMMGACVACGDGITNGTETCDDGNATANDGCSATCVLETGWSCTGTPNVCTPICGDGLLRGNEQCDDRNTTSGDGCSSTCQFDIECGTGEVAVLLTNNTSTPILDNYTGAISSIDVTQMGVVRRVIPTINVSHANTGHLDVFLSSPFGLQRILVNDVGSSANFNVTSFSDTAATAIGTGTAPYTGTYRPVDTISNAAGFANQTAAGSWTLRLSDDSTTIAGTLNSWTLAVCVDPATTAVCGNGHVEPNEQCDDGNANAGDGCDNCQLEFACGTGETRVVIKSTNNPLHIADGNMTGVQAAVNVSDTGVVSKVVVVVNAISHQFNGDVDIALITPMGTTHDVSSDNGGASDNYASTIFDDAATTGIGSGTAPYRGMYRPDVPFTGLLGQPANGSWNLRVVDDGTIDAGLFGTWSLGLCVAPPPVCGNGTVEISEACDDNNTMAGDGCSTTCTVEQGYTCSGTPTSTCTFTCGDGMISGNEQCDDGNTNNGDICNSVCQYEFSPETEPNNMCGETNGPFTVPFIFDGSITPAGDQDFVAFTVPAYADVKLETFIPTLGGCTGGDTVIQLRGTDCTTVLASDDDGGIPLCSNINPAADAGARNLAPGIYYARVEEFGNNGTIAAYKLQVSFVSLCGDGQITSTETCEDGNSMDGDGCGANCQAELGFDCSGSPMLPCTPICGDGLVRGGEGCDDMNTFDGDGCSGFCSVEAGYMCSGEPSVCTP